MAQDSSKWFQGCRKCSAGAGQPCETNRGEVAGKVHYGRGSYREHRRRPVQPAYVPRQRTQEYIDDANELDARRYQN